MDMDAVGEGLASYKGYEYQIMATLWVLLDLMVNSRIDAILVEPPSNEDLEAKLPPDDEDSGLAVSQVQIQIKFRSGSTWKDGDFKNLLSPKAREGKRGPAPRIRPLEYLKGNPTWRYLLLTNADIDPSLVPLRVDKVSGRSSATSFSFGSSDDATLVSRVAILPCQTPEKLRLAIDVLLQRSFHVSGIGLGVLRKVHD